MTSHSFARGLVLSAFLGLALPGIAQARNEHCSGGIQYVVQAMRDKDRGYTEDYERQIKKAIQQLTMCEAEDPADFEAIGYLGWAYAEAESAAAAGAAFEKAIAGLKAKGDIKKMDLVRQNQMSFWAKWFNEGLDRIKTAQAAYPDFCKKPDNEADVTLRGEAEKSYQKGEAAMTRARQIRAGDPLTARNLATVHALQCQFKQAEAILADGLKAAPEDSSLKAAMRVVRVNIANTMVDEKKYDEAITFYAELAKSEPTNADHWLATADIHFRQAQSGPEDTRPGHFRAAGEAYAKASELRSNDGDLSFNAALSFQNAKVYDKALPMWERTLKIRPEDTDALSAMGDVLIELKRCGEAITAVHRAVTLKGDDKILHRQLSSAYTRCGNNPKATEELVVFIALSRGTAAPDAAAAVKEAKQGTAAAKTLASEGVPEQVYEWTADDQKWTSWFYWAKRRAYHFGDNGALSQKSDWATAGVAAGDKK